MRGFRIALVLLPVAVMVAWHWQLSVKARRAAAGAVAEADRLHSGWRLEELEARRQVVADEENSAPTILQAARLLPERFFEQFEHIPGSSQQRPQIQLSREDAAALASNLKKDAAALSLARRLAGLSRGRFPIVYGRDGRSTQTRHVGDCQQVATLLEMDVVLRAQEGDQAQALDSCRAILNAGRAIGDEPLLWSQHTRVTIQLQAVRRAERALAQGPPAEPGLAALQTLVEAESREPVLLFALRGNRAVDYRLTQSFLQGDSRLAQLAHPAWETLAEVLVPLVSGAMEAEQAALLAYDSQLVEAAQQPDSRAELSKVSTAGPNSLLLQSLVFPLNWLIDRFFQAQAELRCLRVGLALERYRLAHGRWPESLQLLVPEQLSEIPADPYDGKPLRYRRLADGVVVYAIGADGIDNGGKLLRSIHPPTGTDVGIQLWDVTRRRQPWKEPTDAGPSGR